MNMVGDDGLSGWQRAAKNIAKVRRQEDGSYYGTQKPY
jgi:hypothetical protein